MPIPNSERLKQLFQFLKASPDDSFILFAIAKEYEGLKAIPQAFEYYHLLRDKTPDYVGLYYHLGKLYETQEDWPTAIATYDKGMEVAKNQGDRHALGELRGAREELEEFE